MNLTEEDRDCLIAYSRKSENLDLALVVGAIQVDLRIAIITEFLENLREYVQAGLKELKLPWCISPIQITEKDYKAKGWVPILSIKCKKSKREIILYKDEEKQRTYLGGKCHGEPVLKREVLKTALEGVGIGGGYHTADNFEWWRRTDSSYHDLSSDSALKTMNLEKDRKVLIKQYGDVLLKAVEAIENLLLTEENFQ